MYCLKTGLCSNTSDNSTKMETSIYDNVPPITKDGTCGPVPYAKCKIGECCSVTGKCGADYDTCNKNKRQDSAYDGDPYPESKTGKCGPLFSQRCPAGQCCTTSGWCGKGDECQNKMADIRFHGAL